MKIFFIFAHPDDEAFGPAGTIAKLTSAGHDVSIISICDGDRPGANVGADRRQAFESSCRTLGAKPWIFDNPDCTLDIRQTTRFVSELVETHKPDVVYTHSIADVHLDHRIVAEACMVAVRPKPNSPTNALFCVEVVPSTTWGFQQFGTFTPNVYEDVSDFLLIKQEVIDKYATECYQYPDARSAQHVIDKARVRGAESGFKYAEAFQLVFSRGHKTP